MKSELGTLAVQYGYHGELCTFLDDIDLEGDGIGPVAKAIKSRLPKFTVIKIALANMGRVFFRDEDSYTCEDWTKIGEDKYIKHCDENGRFRFEDFKPQPSKIDVEETLRIRRLIFGDKA